MTREAKVRFRIGEENARLLDAIGALDQVSQLIMIDDEEESSALNVEWVETEIEICLDSGCCDHVLDLIDAPGYAAFLGESAGSKRGQKYVVGNGQRVKNEGEVVLNMTSDVGGDARLLQSCFQVASVTRPLMSVSRVCDQGLRCIFDDERAIVTDKKTGKEIAVFERRGGLYISKMKLKAPTGFARLPQ